MMRPKRFHGLLLLAGTGAILAVVATGGSAHGQSADTQSLVNRLERLERDVQTLSRQVYRGEAPRPLESAKDAPNGGENGGEGSSAYAARVSEKIAQLEAELRQVTGTVEDMNFNIDQVRKRLDKLVSDVDYRLSALERARQPNASSQPEGASQPVQQGVAPAGPPPISAVPRPAGVTAVGQPTGGPVTGTRSGTLGTISGSQLKQFQEGQGNQPPTEPQSQPAQEASVPAAPPPPAKLLPAGTPTKQYQFALSLLRRAEYDKAEAAFQEFVDSHPDDALTSNARYWLGETFYVRGDFVHAADVFLAGYRQNPKSPKAPDSLLKLGMSLSALDKKKEACATFGKLRTDFPDAPASVQRVLQRERDRAECK